MYKDGMGRCLLITIIHSPNSANIAAATWVEFGAKLLEWAVKPARGQSLTSRLQPISRHRSVPSPRPPRNSQGPQDRPFRHRVLSCSPTPTSNCPIPFAMSSPAGSTADSSPQPEKMPDETHAEVSGASKFHSSAMLRLPSTGRQ